MEEKKIDEKEINYWFNADKFQMSKQYISDKISNIIACLESKNDLIGLETLQKSIIELEIKLGMHDLP